MTQQDPIAKRIEKSVEAFFANDYETCLLQLFPAVDNTSKARRPKKKVGERIKSFLDDQQDIITYIALRIAFKGGIMIDDQTLSDAIYHITRTSIVHEGQLDPRLKFVEEGELRASKDLWILPKNYIFGMIIAVITAKENKQSSLPEDWKIEMFGKEFTLNNIWGEEDKFRQEFLP
ncbi:hypothetical protein QDQ60_02425 [Klebsiella aerogenes]|uniref:hypothetical protein n=1 Tax=Klebsiella aerogenes TaxID=548 RepID=UPI002DB70592|nr:hypothetical protein [Klebsiella aerogenes]MEB6075890.1 hypothetical protein [Klebsiella aerogenes]